MLNTMNGRKVYSWATLKLEYFTKVLSVFFVMVAAKHEKNRIRYVDGHFENECHMCAFVDGLIISSTGRIEDE